MLATPLQPTDTDLRSKGVSTEGHARLSQRPGGKEGRESGPETGPGSSGRCKDTPCRARAPRLPGIAEIKHQAPSRFVEAHWPHASSPWPCGVPIITTLRAQGQQWLCLCGPQPSRASLLAAPTKPGPSLSSVKALCTHHSPLVAWK